MSVVRVVTRGYGSFSDVNEVPVRGYATSGDPEPEPEPGPPGGDFFVGMILDVGRLLRP